MRLSLLVPALLVSTVALAERVPQAGTSASSEYVETDGTRYGAAQAADGKQTTAWVEGQDGSGLGSWVQVDLGGEKNVTKIRVWGGLWDSHDSFVRANRPKDIEVKFSDGSVQTFTLKDEMVAQDFVLKAPKATTSVRVGIKSIYNGTTWLDTGIAEIQVFDGATDPLAVTAAAASSKMASDGDGNYEPSNAADGLADSMWCEGSADGDGTGEWLEVKFGGPTAISKMKIVNGVGSSMAVYMKANRAKTATLAFSDGTSAVVALKPIAFAPQEVTFPAVTTSSVKLRFDEVVKGKEYNDLCVSEVAFAK